MLPETKYCKKCDTNKPISEFTLKKSGRYAGQPVSYCKTCRSLISIAWAKAHRDRSREIARNWNANNPDRVLQHKEKFRANHPEKFHPAAETPTCTHYLGSYISETVLSREFKNIKRMPSNFPGYDFECNRHFLIDVKSSCQQYHDSKSGYWQFMIKQNKIPHYFLLIAWDNRDDLNPLYIWLIPAKLINDKLLFVIGNTEKSLAKWKKYERPLNNVLSCCRTMRAKKLLEEDVEEVFKI